MSDLQKTHDELASALLKLVDQMIRGSHAPMVYQIDDALRAILNASPNVQQVPGYTVSQAYLPKFVETLRERLHKVATEETAEATS